MNRDWRGQQERGSRGAMRLIVWLALHAGRPLCRVLLAPISLYFVLTAPLARQASRAFLTRVRGRSATFADVWRHLFVFATTLLDRVYLVNGRHRELSIEVENEAPMLAAAASGRGCILLGSHLGSFQMLGIVGSVERKLAINVVMHVGDTAQLHRLIGRGVELPYRIIPLGDPGSMLRAKECLDRGEVVGILADRVYGDEQTQPVEFMGSPARFSLSPLRLARMTGAPVVMAFGLFEGGRRYRIVFEALAGRVLADDAAAGAAADAGAAGMPVAALSATLARYVSNLERHARRHPHNWFNFYDYWEHRP